MSFLFGETERDEYERLLKNKIVTDDFVNKFKEAGKKDKELREKENQRLKYLEEKFNPKKDKPSIYEDKPSTYKEQSERIVKHRIENFKNNIIILKKQNPKISLEEAILRTIPFSKKFYEDDEIIKMFKLEKYPPNAPPLPSPPKRFSPKSKSKLTNETLQMAKSKLRPKAPPNPPPLPKSVTRVRKPLQSPRKSTSNNSPKFLDGNRAETDKQTQSPPKTNSPKSKLTKEGLEMAKSKLKPKGPPNPPPLPSPPKRSSPKKSKSKLTKEGLEMAKSKLKHIQKNLNPDNPDYDLEMAFRKLEK